MTNRHRKVLKFFFNRNILFTQAAKFIMHPRLNIMDLFILTISEIYDLVRKVPGFDEELYRPEIFESALNDDQMEPNLINLMINCWAEDPHDRPDFSVIRKVVRSLNKLIF